MINSLLSGIAPEQNVYPQRSANLTKSVSDTSFADAAAQATTAAKSESLGPAFNLTLSDEATNFLLQLAQQGEAAGRPSSDEIFAKLDSNGDGSLSEAEFVEGRPNFASEEQATAKFAELDTDESGTLTQAEAEAGATSQSAQAGAGAPPPPPPPPSGGGASLSELFDELDTDESGVVELDELMAGLDEAAEENAAIEGDATEVGASAYEAEQSLTAAFLNQLDTAIQSYLSAGAQQAEPQLLASA